MDTLTQSYKKEIMASMQLKVHCIASSKPQSCYNNRNRTEWASPGAEEGLLDWHGDSSLKHECILGLIFQLDQLFYNIESLKQSYKNCQKYTKKKNHSLSFHSGDRDNRRHTRAIPAVNFGSQTIPWYVAPT